MFLTQLTKIINYSKFASYTIIYNNKLVFDDFEIFFVFNKNKIIGLECDPEDSFDHDNFFTIVEYIGSIQINNLSNF